MSFVLQFFTSFSFLKIQFLGQHFFDVTHITPTLGQQHFFDENFWFFNKASLMAINDDDMKPKHYVAPCRTDYLLHTQISLNFFITNVSVRFKKSIVKRKTWKF